ANGNEPQIEQWLAFRTLADRTQHRFHRLTRFERRGLDAVVDQSTHYRSIVQLDGADNERRFALARMGVYYSRSQQRATAGDVRRLQRLAGAPALLATVGLHGKEDVPASATPAAERAASAGCRGPVRRLIQMRLEESSCWHD